jgi:hypothetical protein
VFCDFFQKDIGEKFAPKMSVKLTTEVNFINVLCERFSFKILAPKITKLCFGFEIFWRQNFVQKCARKTMMKLTAEV